MVKKSVAVKIFLDNVTDFLSDSSISELLELSRQPKHLLHAYKEIRQEVSFLSNLDHKNLTKLLGVRTSPYMCLVLELAPKKSLQAVLNDYKECLVVLEPLTLKSTALQVCILFILVAYDHVVDCMCGSVCLFILLLKQWYMHKP